MVAIQQRLVCDLCGSDEGTETMTVVWKYSEGKPWEIDLCARCYGNRMADIAEKGRRATRNNVRPQYRIKKTEISNKDL